MPFKPPRHDAERVKRHRHAYERQRGNSRERGYTTAWDKESAAHRRDHPLCVRCKSRGKTVACDVTDHIKPARWFPWLFWVQSNWQSLCYACNNEKTHEDEKLYGHLPPGGGSKT